MYPDGQDIESFIIVHFTGVFFLIWKTRPYTRHHRRVRVGRGSIVVGCGPGKGLNEDMGSYIRTDIWDPVLNHIRDN